MFFLLKRTWLLALTALAVLALVGWPLRWRIPDGPPLTLSPQVFLIGLGVFGAILCIDGTIHGLLWLLFRDRYFDRYQELAAVFRGQSPAAILAGAAMAGVGEEVLFRGLSHEPLYLGIAAVIFGLLHHIRGRLWLFTIWSIWEGVLFAVAIWYTGDLMVTMTAHFLHDLAGFLIFRHLNSTSQASAVSDPCP